jgi:GxxExxY protein
MTENEISYKIRGATFRIHKELGPGLLEKVYEAALAYELSNEELEVTTQMGVPMNYKDIKFDIGFKLDVLVNDKVMVEIKSVESLTDVQFKQLLTYLRLCKKKLGILINFNCSE